MPPRPWTIAWPPTVGLPRPPLRRLVRFPRYHLRVQPAEGARLRSSLLAQPTADVSGTQVGLPTRYDAFTSRSTRHQRRSRSCPLSRQTPKLWSL